MKTFINITLLLMSLLASCQENKYIYNFNLKEIASKNPKVCNFQKSQVFARDVITFSPKTDADFLEFLNPSEIIDWTKANYLVCEMYHDNPYSAIIYLNFIKKNNKDKKIIVQQGEQNTENQHEAPQIAPKIGILPFLKTQLIFPVSYLDGQKIFLPKFPRQLKGTVAGHRMDLTDLAKIQLVLNPVMSPEFLPKMQIASIYFSEELPKPYPKPEKPVVDKFGQWTIKDWPGKIKDEKELVEKTRNLEKQSVNTSYPSEWSKYGGWTGKKFKPTGYFRTENDGKRWWMVDPDGNAFLSAGIDCIRANSNMALSGNEDLVEWLPDVNDSIFGDAYYFDKSREQKGIDYFKTNLMRVYGSQWREKWEETTINLLKLFRVNTIANWSEIDFAKKSKIPYVLPMRGFPTTEVKLFRDFPDVFDTVYNNGAIKFARQLDTYKNDPYLIGYFLDNEPHWAFGEFNLAFEMFATNSKSFTKKELVNWLKKLYSNNLHEFNTSWNLQFISFEDLENQVFKEETQLSEKARVQLKEFSGLMVDRLVKIVCDEVKKVDPNHLNLGLRYAWISSELCYRAGNYFDVFSINGYSNPAPPNTEEVARRSGKPVMIGEFHFGSIDRGLPATGIQAAENQKARGDAYRYYVENGFARPELIGIHYFQWIDQPVLGRFDGENYNIGVVDITNQPYEEFTQAIKLSLEKMYKVASGVEKPFNLIIKKMPQIFY